MPYFVVINEQGPSWVDSRPMRDQDLWTEHAAFINSLMYAGLIVLGGPLGSGRPHRALLIFHAESEPLLRDRLMEDPWMRSGHLRIGSIEPWNILVSHEKLDPVLTDLTKPTTSP